MSTIDPIRIVTGSHRTEFDGMPVGKPSVNESVEVVMHLRRKRVLHTPALMSAGLFLPRHILKAQFGAAEDDVAAVVEFARAHDLWVDKIESNKRLIRLHANLSIGNADAGKSGDR
jgi:hypothetical protein